MSGYSRNDLITDGVALGIVYLIERGGYGGVFFRLMVQFILIMAAVTYWMTCYDPHGTEQAYVALYMLFMGFMAIFRPIAYLVACNGFWRLHWLHWLGLWMFQPIPSWAKD